MSKQGKRKAWFWRAHGRDAWPVPKDAPSPARAALDTRLTRSVRLRRA